MKVTINGYTNCANMILPLILPRIDFFLDQQCYEVSFFKRQRFLLCGRMENVLFKHSEVFINISGTRMQSYTLFIYKEPYFFSRCCFYW